MKIPPKLKGKFREALHKRIGKGNPGAGQFASKNTGQLNASSSIPPKKVIAKIKTAIQSKKSIESKLKTSEIFGDVSRIPQSSGSKIKSEKQMFGLAPKVKNTFDEILDRGKGLSVDLGSSVIDMSKPGADFDKALSTKGSVIILGTIKSRERSAEKVEVDYKGDWSKLKDVIRGTVAVDGAGDIPNTVKALDKKMSDMGYSLLQQPKNNYEKPMGTGYRDINLIYSSPEGFPMEVQINTKSMLQAKQGQGHKYYEEIRGIDSRADRERRDLTAQEMSRKEQLSSDSKQLYNSAYLKSFGRAA
jgi:hypothetical protein